MKQTLNLVYLILLVACFSCSKPLAPLDLNSEWLFMTGDDSTYMNIDIPTGKWKTILPGSSWESQGYTDYDGIAWYRKEALFSTTLKSQLSEETPYFILQLGSIDDADICYFNGTKIGNSGNPEFMINGENMILRKYILPADLVNWEGKNVLAIKVIDHEGEGGLISGPYTIEAAKWDDVFSMKTSLDGGMDGYFDEGLSILASMEFNNRTSDALSGTISLTILNISNEIIDNQEDQLTVLSGEKISYLFEYTPPKSGAYVAQFKFNTEEASKSEVMIDTFAYGIPTDQPISSFFK